MSGRSSYDQTDSVEIQRAKAQREREQQIRQFKEEAETCPIQQTGLLHHNLFPAPRKLADGDPTARRILGEYESIRRNYDSFIGIQGDQPQTPQPRKSRSLGFAFPKISPENNKKSTPTVNGIIKPVPPVDQKSSSSSLSSATSRHTSASTSSRHSSSKYESSSANFSDRTSTNQKREKDKRRSSKERGVNGGSASEKSSHKSNNDHRHDNKSPATGVSNNQHHHDESRSRSHSPYGGSSGGTSQKSSKSHQSVHTVPEVKSHSKPPHKEEISPKKSALHSPPNGAVIPDGALEQLKKKIPKLQLPQKNKTTLTSGLSTESSQDVDDILKEMTGTSYIQPHNPIYTPVKDHKKFPFPAVVAPVESHHLRNVFSLENELKGEAHGKSPDGKSPDGKSPDKTEVKDADITNGKMDIDSDNEAEEIAPTVKSPQNRSVTTTSLVEKGGGVPKSGRGRPTAPVKENSNLKSMSSDESSGSGSEYSSGESESEDNSTDDEEEKKKEDEIPKPKTPPPLISPPPSNEKKSWALGNFIPPPDCPSPNFTTNANISDKSLNGSFKEDPNNDLLDDLIPNIIENFGNNSDGDHEFDLDPFDHVNRRNKNLLNNKNPFGKIKDICSSEGGSSDEEEEDTKSSFNHISSSSSPKWTHQVNSAPSKNGFSSEKNKSKNETTPLAKKQSKHVGKKVITPLSEKKSKKSQKAKIESDNEEEFVDVEYLTPEKMEAREEHNVDIIKNNKSAVTKLDFSDCETTPKQKELDNVCSRKNSATEEKSSSKKSEKRKYVKSENKNSGKSAKEVTKSEKNSKKNSNSKTKDRDKHKDKKRSENKENEENEKDNSSSNLSMDKDIQEMITFKPLSPIPHIPDKIATALTSSSDKTPIITSSTSSSSAAAEKVENTVFEKSLKSDKILQEDKKYDGLTFIDGTPSIIVQIDLSLLGNLDDLDNSGGKDVFSNTELSEVKHSLDTESFMPSLDEPDLSSPKSKLDSSFSSQTSQLSATSHTTCSVKSSKRKVDCDRNETSSKRRKSATKSASKRTASDSVIQTEEESHEDDHKWDRKWDERSQKKDRHDSTSSNSSQHNGQLPKKSKNLITEDTELDKPSSDFEIKDEQLPSVTTSSEGQLSSVETFYDREGDMEAHVEPSRFTIKPIEERLESADCHLAKAKELKHYADSLTDRLAKSMAYTEAILSFIQCGCAMEREQLSDITKIFTMYRDTFKLVTHICRFRSTHDSELTDKEKILAVLSLRIQSLICLKLFKLKKPETLKYKRIIEDHNKASSKAPTLQSHAAPSPHQASWNNRSNGTPSPMSPVPPSPAGSIGSVGSQGSCNETPSKLPNGTISTSSAASTSMSSPSTVSIPQRIHSITQQYFTTSSFLLQCHDYWDQADLAVSDYREFFEDLDDNCGPLSLHSSIPELVIYVQTGLQHLKNT